MRTMTNITIYTHNYLMIQTTRADTYNNHINTATYIKLHIHTTTHTKYRYISYTVYLQSLRKLERKPKCIEVGV